MPGPRIFSYYMTQRPPGPGTLPIKGLMAIHPYNGKTYVHAIKRTAWANVHYCRELTDQEVKDYELAKESADA